MGCDRSPPIIDRIERKHEPYGLSAVLGTQRFRFIGTRHDTAIIVGQHHNRLASQYRVEDPLTGRIKVVAIDKGEDRRHGDHLQRVNHVCDNAPNLEGLLSLDLYGLIVLVSAQRPVEGDYALLDT